MSLTSGYLGKHVPPSVLDADDSSDDEETGLQEQSLHKNKRNTNDLIRYNLYRISYT